MICLYWNWGVEKDDKIPETVPQIVIWWQVPFKLTHEKVLDLLSDSQDRHACTCCWAGCAFDGPYWVAQQGAFVITTNSNPIPHPHTRHGGALSPSQSLSYSPLLLFLGGSVHHKATLSESRNWVQLWWRNSPTRGLISEYLHTVPRCGANT